MGVKVRPKELNFLLITTGRTERLEKLLLLDALLN
jgi:hypothetical protein